MYVYGDLILATVILISCAALGWLIGRLVRGRPPKVEAMRPRLSISTACLRDAHNSALSVHTRLRCAFESAYFCCCEIAEKSGKNIEDYEHPSNDVMKIGMMKLGAREDERRVFLLLAKWVSSASPLLPEVGVKEACGFAIHVHDEAVRVLS